MYKNKKDRVLYFRKYMRKRRKTHRIEISKIQQKAGKKYRLKNQLKIKARRQIEYRIRNGRLKQLPCSVCKLLPTEAHHPDYSKPLEIIWLCKEHHANQHYSSV